MVNIKDEGGELVFEMSKLTNISETGNIIRISPDAAKVIDEIRIETGLSIRAVADELIKFAGKHYSVRHSESEV